MNLSHRPTYIDGNLCHRPSHTDGNLSHRPSHRDGNLSHRPSHADVIYISVTDCDADGGYTNSFFSSIDIEETNVKRYEDEEKMMEAVDHNNNCQ